MDGLIDEPYVLTEDERSTVSNDCGEPFTAYLEPLLVGDHWPAILVFLQAGMHVLLPLETSYMTVWNKQSRHIRKQILDAATQG